MKSFYFIFLFVPLFYRLDSLTEFVTKTLVSFMDTVLVLCTDINIFFFLYLMENCERKCHSLSHPPCINLYNLTFLLLLQVCPFLQIKLFYKEIAIRKLCYTLATQTKSANHFLPLRNFDYQ